MQYHAPYAWLGGETVATDVVIDVVDGTIVSLFSGASCPGGAERLDGVVLPGLVNAHSHAFHRALRGRTAVGAGDFWAWRDVMYGVAARLDPDRYFALAVGVFAEMALAGITTVGEFHYVHHQVDGTPYDEPNALGLAIIEAAKAVGLRLTLLDVCYLQSGFARPVLAEQRRFSDGDVNSWFERVDALAGSELVRIGAAPHSVRALDEASLRAIAAWPGVIHAHVSEQSAENEACVAATGRTPVELLHDCGLVTDRFTAVHATHLSSGDIAALGGSHVCFCPTTERDLADGVGPAAALVAAGASLSLGSDSHAVIDLFEEARAVELDERLVSNERGRHRPVDLLHMATTGGAASLGWPELAGGLVVGAPADFCVVNTGSVRLAGFDQRFGPAQLIAGAHPSDVRDVVVNGRRIVRAGQHAAIEDVSGLLDRSIKEVLG